MPPKPFRDSIENYTYSKIQQMLWRDKLRYPQQIKSLLHVFHPITIRCIHSQQPSLHAPKWMLPFIHLTLAYTNALPNPGHRCYVSFISPLGNSAETSGVDMHISVLSHLPPPSPGFSSSLPSSDSLQSMSLSSQLFCLAYQTGKPVQLLRALGRFYSIHP